MLYFLDIRLFPDFSKTLYILESSIIEETINP